jgi:pimeloyl-ACP methyl ester carboxylesterase
VQLVDYPGLGDSPLDPAIDSLDGLYRRVMTWLPDRCDLVALSMGCVLALRAAIEQPERVARLVLIAAAGGVDVGGLGGTDWRPGWRARRPDAPPWFLDDRTDYTDRLGRIVAPTLIICGDSDPISPLPVGDVLRAKIPGARLEVVHGGSHDLENEYPEAIARMIVQHLDDPAWAR